ncbi:DEAD/DEAH box helicase, partial [Candidatus Woesearchaeota archaeon]|nr:DEAD/DEAH box helicase [Candidatus Woesearchaeota archaeon]
MLVTLKEPYTEKEVRKILNPLVAKWFFSKFKEFSLPQLFGVREIHEGNNILVSAPTGGTKTLTSCLSIINELVTLAENNLLEDKIYCLYINPLRALSRDIEVNLKGPIEEIKEIAKKEGKELDIRVAARTGDTSPSEKQKQLKKSPHILVLTPETLAIVLSSIKFK